MAHRESYIPEAYLGITIPPGRKVCLVCICNAFPQEEKGRRTNTLKETMDEPLWTISPSTGEKNEDVAVDMLKTNRKKTL